MNKAITQGLVLMPPPFSAGLGLWSREDGLSGQGSYLGQANAAYVPADQDFSGCLELQKTTAVQKLRCFQSIPCQPGMYLRVTARVKAISGALPVVRIAGWAGSGSGTNVTTADQQGPNVALTGYGSVVTVSAIIGSGNRPGVDMVWGTAPAFGHFGIDLTGPTGGVVRIDDITIEDVTGVFHTEMFDWVDVRDYGAVGDGVTDDRAAFDAADTAAAGKTVVVSPGVYFIGSHLTFENPVQFEGTIVMPDNQRLACTRNYNLDTYAAAFGSELAGFKKALQVLFYFTDHVTLDLNGRRVELTAPINVATLCGLSSFSTRRALVNGNLVALPGAAWNTQTVSAVATYAVGNPLVLTGVANIAAIPVGARVSGSGVGREVYVTSKNVGASTISLSQPLWAAAGTRTFTFERYAYLLDFSGFTELTRFQIKGVEFSCASIASGINLATAGAIFDVSECMFGLVKDRAITSTGEGCQDLHVDRCQFFSADQGQLAQNRNSIVFNANANDIKIRNNRSSRFGHFGIVAGSGGLFVGNHFFGGDDSPNGLRRAGVVLTLPNSKTFFTGNYVDNSFIELSNEHDATPEYSNEYSFGGVSLTGNVFTAQNVVPWFSWIVITPRGPGHFISGLSVTGNVFYARSGDIDRVESVDTSHGTLAFNAFRNVNFEQNTFNGVIQRAISPMVVEHVQNTVSDTWAVNSNNLLPFGGRARNVVAVVAEGAITNGAGAVQFVAPYTQVEQGAGGQFANLKWPSPVKGRVQVTLRVDNPV
ncbi:MAG: glycosyl hydrolase family 28-related protein [Cypionkella sp.]|uniref:glycosyl hydrolase family 28-related protein n=1 Tax=Cypionkella sp. TaxID=2811411 RepID=UPI002AB8ABBB|nr:glycosyl hydrolase family 28-related protein [Cypionkella sp.]MDZ4310290.1 glycosyl hydrolase family 28-related protein [Cypionkella sp.]